MILFKPIFYKNLGYNASCSNYHLLDRKEFNMPNIITDYSQYNEKQLYNFLNSIEKQLLKAEGDKNKAIKKIQECELQEQMIRQVLAQKHSQEKEPTQSLLNTINSKDDPEYDVSFGDFNDFLQIAKQERERHDT